MKILVDMNLSPTWVPFLVERGFPAVHWSTIGAAFASDSEILGYAEKHGLIVFTHELDFGMLLAALKTRGPSVIQIRSQDVLPAVIGETVLRAIKVALPSLEAGALVTVDRAQGRIRLLPI